MLNVDSDKKGETDSDTHLNDSDASTDPTEIKKRNTKPQSKPKSTKGRKKNTKGRKQKGKGKDKQDTGGSEGPDISLASYRIIGDEDGTAMEYLVAICSLVQQMAIFRHDLQRVWRQVAYQNLNTAVASSLGSIAIGMIKTTQSQIFVDFPGHDSFNTIMETLDPDQAQGSFQLQFASHGPHGNTVPMGSSEVDMKEEFFLRAYKDLLDFIIDFQKTRSGKPTKAMLKSLQNWDPKFDLQQATAEQRLSWRRVFTINWLYDLVNVFSSVVIERQTLEKQNIDLETVDWSKNGSWYAHRRLYGLNEFAGDITHLAMQKPMHGTNIKSKILPHHVFQLQCIVDSLAVSRGWTVSIMMGHVLGPPAAGFRPLRDVDIFMDRDTIRSDTGLCQSVHVLTQLLNQDANLHDDPNWHAPCIRLLTGTRYDLVNWLGVSKCMCEPHTIPPSRFSCTNSNGLWEYSPFLCGAGLSEALDQMCAIGLTTWDKAPELMCIIHLHNMLLQKGLLEQPVKLWGSLEELFKDSFFREGKVPTSDFVDSFKDLISRASSRRKVAQNKSRRHEVAKWATDVAGIFDPSLNRVFKAGSYLRALHKAEWDLDRIRDEDIPFSTALAFMRIAEAKKTFDPVTGKVALVDNDLISRAKSGGATDEQLIEESSMFLSLMKKKEPGDNILNRLKSMTPGKFKSGTLPVGTLEKGINISSLMDALQEDLMGDISTQVRPMSSLNYIWISSIAHRFFLAMEDTLESCRNPTWHEAYESQDPILTKHKRSTFTAIALKGQDSECLEIIRDTFESTRAAYDILDCMYWELLEPSEADKTHPDAKPEPRNDPDACLVM